MYLGRSRVFRPLFIPLKYIVLVIFVTNYVEEHYTSDSN